MKSLNILRKSKAKAVPSRPLMLVLVSALLLGVIPSSRAAAITVVSPQAYENTEGETSIAEGSFGPFRYQQVFPAADFAAPRRAAALDHIVHSAPGSISDESPHGDVSRQPDPSIYHPNIP